MGTIEYVPGVIPNVDPTTPIVNNQWSVPGHAKEFRKLGVEGNPQLSGTYLFRSDGWVLGLRLRV